MLLMRAEVVIAGVFKCRRGCRIQSNRRQQQTLTTTKTVLIGMGRMKAKAVHQTWHTKMQGKASSIFSPEALFGDKS